MNDYFGLQDLCQELKGSREPKTKKDDDNTIMLDVGGKSLRPPEPHWPGGPMFTPSASTAPPVTKKGNYFIDTNPHIPTEWTQRTKDQTEREEPNALEFKVAHP